MRIGSDAVTSAYPLASRPNFTTMSRLEMREWMNNEIKRGAMTLDESTPFVFMTLHMPVGDDPTSIAANAKAIEEEQVDFVDAAQRGIRAAQARGERDTQRLMESALMIMRRYQQ